MSKYLPDDMIRDTIRDLLNGRVFVLTEKTENMLWDWVKDELTQLGYLRMWLDNLPPSGAAQEEEEVANFRNVIDVGKRMRATQQDYFKTRNYVTLRMAKQLETEFDKLLEEAEKLYDEP